MPKTKDITIVFLLSLPRSGSTLMQRVLAANTSIKTVAEPWLMLPLMYSVKDHGVYTEFGHDLARRAMRDLFDSHPCGMEAFLRNLGGAAHAFYADICSNQHTHFVDKTPRYSLIISELRKAMPNAKYVYLWRNPLAVIASMMDTYSAGKWNLFRFKVDLFDGLEQLVRDQQENAGSSCVVRYEDFLAAPVGTTKHVCDYLGITWCQGMVSDFSGVELAGEMGDPTGAKKYRSLNRDREHRWKSVINNPVRKWWAKRYLDWVGRERLSIMGYDYDSLIAELRSCSNSPRYILSDVFRIAFGKIVSVVEPFILRDKLRKTLDRQTLYFHR